MEYHGEGKAWVNGYKVNRYGYGEQFPYQFFVFLGAFWQGNHGVDGYGNNGYSCR